MEYLILGFQVVILFFILYRNSAEERESQRVALIQKKEYESSPEFLEKQTKTNENIERAKLAEKPKFVVAIFNKDTSEEVLGGFEVLNSTYTLCNDVEAIATLKGNAEYFTYKKDEGIVKLKNSDASVNYYIDRKTFSIHGKFKLSVNQQDIDSFLRMQSAYKNQIIHNKNQKQLDTLRLLKEREDYIDKLFKD